MHNLEIKIQKRTVDLHKEKDSLEKKVVERTRKLEETVAELKNLNRFMVGRENKMVELKEELEQLRKRSRS